MKFLIDMPLSPNLAAWLRERGHDALHADELDLAHASDSKIMDFARDAGRTIITADLDYPRLLAVAELRNPSLILFREGNWSDSQNISRMNEVLRTLPENDIAESIIVVDRDRVRRRRLPIVP